MPYFCNRCDDLCELRVKPLNWILMLIVGAIIGAIFAFLWIYLFLISFLIGIFIIYKIHSSQTPFCHQCSGIDYYEIAPHEAAGLKHGKKMREEQRDFQTQMMDQMRGMQETQQNK